MGADLADFVRRWQDSGSSERATKDQFLLELCDVLGVPRPDPATGDPAKDRYVFEYAVRELDESGKTHTKFIDFYREGHFVLEAKQGGHEGTKKAGTARRGTDGWHIAMNAAKGQALGYARLLDKPVPMLVVCDIGHCFDLFESFDGSGVYRGFPTAQTSRIFLKDLAAHADTLRLALSDPMSLDPSRRAAKMTREVAEYLANLAKRLEADGHPQETIARFLMRCLFTMFAEDIGLLPEHLFTKLLRERWVPKPETFPGGVRALWEKMNTGGDMVLAHVRHFNGGLFADTTALPLDEHALRLLLVAAERDWTDVEPAIFGTLLERALDAKERHRLGAHYTPKAYVERLVRPTIEEPLRAEWDVVRAQIEKLRPGIEKAKAGPAKTKKRNEAVAIVEAFHKKLAETRVLDPACGTGNFLYVAMHFFQQLESEILQVLESLGRTQDLMRFEGWRVTPAQFLGIEIKGWAKEIAELVLWIGYLQWHFRMLGKKPPTFEPVLHDYKNIENRDALLAYDRREPLLDDEGKPVTRWDGETTKVHPVTKKGVPDERATVPVYRYVNPRKAEWPKADYIVGNPPFIGGWRVRGMLGDGYLEALWATYHNVPDKADYVMYWWDRAAELTSSGSSRQFGLITTNSVTQVFQRRLLHHHLDAAGSKLELAFAIPDHPWIDSSEAAAVRVAMTVGRRVGTSSHQPVLATVARESSNGTVDFAATTTGRINADLTVGVDVASVAPLRANSAVCSPGVQLYGSGFILNADEAARLREKAPSADGAAIIKPYVNGRDFSARSRGAFVIDFFGLGEDDAARLHPAAFQHVLIHVKPDRDQNRRPAIRDTWWRFGWERPVLRAATSGLRRFVVTPETAKHRVFQFLGTSTLPDNMLTCVALEDAFFLGALSARTHVVWALAAGGRLGVGNDPRYTKTRCFEPFPFPDPSAELRERIGNLAEALDAHRKARQAAHPDLTITGMYNVLEKLRAGEPLTDKDAAIHEKGLVSILKKLHDDIDAAVFEAYGWPATLTDEQILERLVALNAERAAEEKRGQVRWLRPDFQNPAAHVPAVQTSTGAEEAPDEEAAPVTTVAAKLWPRALPDQFVALRDLLESAYGLLALNSVVDDFKGAKPTEVKGMLESLAALGLVVIFPDEKGPLYKSVTAPRRQVESAPLVIFDTGEESPGAPPPEHHVLPLASSLPTGQREGGAAKNAN